MIISHMPVSSLVMKDLLLVFIMLLCINDYLTHACIIAGDEGSLTYLCLSCSSVSMNISHMPVSSLVMKDLLLVFIMLLCINDYLTHACIIAGDEGSLTYLCLSCSSVSMNISHMPVSSLVMKDLLLVFIMLLCINEHLTHACIIAGDEGSLTCVYHAPLYQ